MDEKTEAPHPVATWRPVALLTLEQVEQFDDFRVQFRTVLQAWQTAHPTTPRLCGERYVRLGAFGCPHRAEELTREERPFAPLR